MSDWINSRSEFDDVTREGNVVILFTAPPRCVPCQRFEPHYERAKAVAEENNLPVKFYRVHVDVQQWAMVDFGIRSVPTCWVYRDGEAIDEIKVPQGGLPFLKELSTILGV